MSGGPLQFQQQRLLITHATGATQHGFDGRIDRFDDAEPHGMIAVGRDALDVLQEKVAELFHLRQTLPAQGLEPSHQEIENARSRLVGPEPIELLAQHVGFEQPPIRSEQRLELRALRAANRFPAAQQQPALAAAVPSRPPTPTAVRAGGRLPPSAVYDGVEFGWQIGHSE